MNEARQEGKEREGGGEERRRLSVGLLCMMGLMVLCAGMAMAQTTRITCDRDGGPCYGTNGDDLIQGSAMSDFIHARGGTDGVNAARGSDFVFGGRGNDDPGGSPNGHNPAYHLEGGPGRDVVRGGAGEDSVTDEFGPLNGAPLRTYRLFGGGSYDFWTPRRRRSRPADFGTGGATCTL